DHPDGEIDGVSPQREFLEFLDHGSLPRFDSSSACCPSFPRAPPIGAYRRSAVLISKSLTAQSPAKTHLGRHGAPQRPRDGYCTAKIRSEENRLQGYRPSRPQTETFVELPLRWPSSAMA